MRPEEPRIAFPNAESPLARAFLLYPDAA